MMKKLKHFSQSSSGKRWFERPDDESFQRRTWRPCAQRHQCKWFLSSSSFTDLLKWFDFLMCRQCRQMKKENNCWQRNGWSLKQSGQLVAPRQNVSKNSWTIFRASTNPARDIGWKWRRTIWLMELWLTLQTFWFWERTTELEGKVEMNGFRFVIFRQITSEITFLVLFLHISIKFIASLMEKGKKRDGPQKHPRGILGHTAKSGAESGLPLSLLSWTDPKFIAPWIAFFSVCEPCWSARSFGELLFDLTKCSEHLIFLWRRHLVDFSDGCSRPRFQHLEDSHEGRGLWRLDSGETSKGIET